MSDQLTRHDFRASVCNIADLSIKFTLDEAFGEPLITSSMQWTAGPNTPPDCLPRITFVYLRIKRSDGAFGYLKLSPEIGRSGGEFGATATESPFWNRLICDGIAKTSSCLPAEQAQREYANLTAVEGFEVVAEASIAQQIAAMEPARQSKPRSTDDDFAPDFSFDSMLEKAIDSTIVGTETPVADAVSPATPGAQEAAAEKTPSREELAREQAMAEDQLADQAKDNVVKLISTTFAQYKTPPHSCESDRTVANWVRVTGRCELNFRSESSHDFLCGNDGEPHKVTTTRTTDVDFGHDVAEVSPLRVSEGGWVALVLKLKEKLGSTDSGDYKVDRWQFTGTKAQVDDMSSLASSLATLKQYCEKRADVQG